MRGIPALTVALLVISAVPCGVAFAQADRPGAQDAIDMAIDDAVAKAVDQALEALPEGIESVAIFPLVGDTTDDRATDRVEHLVVQKAAGQFKKVVTRDNDRFKELMTEFKFSERRFDIMPEEEVSKFGKFLGVDAIVSGKLRKAEMDDTGVRAVAEVSLRLTVVETGQVAGSGESREVVSIDPETTVVWLMNQPWFWRVVIIAAVVACVLALVVVFVWFPIRRKIALASKPREVR